MAEQPAAEKTEQPTPKRLEKARKRGQTPQSQELFSVVELFVLVGMVTILAPGLMDWLTNLMKEGMTCTTGVFADERTFIKFADAKILSSIVIIFPILAVLAAGAMAAGLVISGVNFAPEAVKPNLDAISPATGLQNLINTKTLVKLVVSIFKLVFVSLIVLIYLSDKKDTMMGLRWAWSMQILSVIAKITFGLCIRVCIALLVIAIGDTIYQKWRYIQDLKMTRQEVKQERRDTDGSPEVKSRIRRIQLQMAMKQMLHEVPKANVVLVNPTHIAVALRYEAKTMEAPKMVAKGADYMATKIMEIARSYGVAIVRRPELARTIYSTVEVGQPIPQSLYVAVAEVLAMLHRLRRRRR